MRRKGVPVVFFLCLLILAGVLGSCTFLLAGQAPPQTPQPVGPRLEDGTPVKIRLKENLSSATAQTNDRVDFDVLEEIRVGDLVVIPKGSTVWGTVTEAEAKRRMGRGGKLDVNIDAVRLGDGEKAALRGVKDVKGGGHTGAMTGGMVATGLLVWPAAPLFLLMHGKDVTIPQGTELTVYVNGDFPIDPAKFGGSPGTNPRVEGPAAAGAPTIVLVDPSVTDSNETVSLATSSITIRGVVTDPSGIPVVTINGNPVGLLPKGPQAASFTSEAIKLQPGDTTFEIVAVDAAHVQAKMTFVARYAPAVMLSSQTTTKPASKTLTKQEILGLLQGGVPSARVVQIVNDRGIGFTPTDDDLKEIRAAGGGDDLVNALAKGKR